LTSVTDARAGAVLDYLGVPPVDDAPELLERVGDRALWVLRKPGFLNTTSDGSLEFTDTGYALAADLC
jgi:hypothetical protein